METDNVQGEPWHPPKRTWFKKFSDAAVGVQLGIIDQSSFAIHAIAAVAVVVIAAILKCDWISWSLLVLCIGTVFATELINSSLESLARGLCHQSNPQVGQALDIASGAVLIASLTAVLVGFIVLGRSLLFWLGVL